MPTNYKTIINFRDGIQVDANDLVSVGGQVGIGSTIPRETLDVRGNVIVENETNLNHLNVSGFATYYGNINVAVGYSVGIGTTVPEAAFQVGVGTTGFTVDSDGNVTAQSFSGDGAGLVNLPTSVWENDNPGVGSTIYAFRPVGVSVTFPTADFAVGDLILVDAISGVGTFQQIAAKELNLSGNAQQGNITMTGTISGIQSITDGTGNFETTGVGSFGGLNISTGVMIGTSGGLTVTGSEKTIDFNQNLVDTDRRLGIRFIETSGGSPRQAILYNGSITGTSGTEGGQIEIWGDNRTTYLPRVIITREGQVAIGKTRVDVDFDLDVVGTGTFTGSVTSNGGFIGDVIGDITGVAGLAEGLTGVPDISVDQIDSLGINSIFIRNTGVSTFGGEVLVGNFVGVGSTASASGKGLGVIGDADIAGDGSFSGNLVVGGDLSIGGTFGGSVNINDVTATELVVLGIISGTSASSAILNDTTITGNVSIGTDKDLTVGGSISIANTTTIGPNLFLGDSQTVVSAAGTLNANLSGILTTTEIVCETLTVSSLFSYTGAGINTFGNIQLDGISGLVSCIGVNAQTGVITCGSIISSGDIQCGIITASGDLECINITSTGSLEVLNINATSGVCTVENLVISDGTATDLSLTRIGFNTAASQGGIEEGIAFFDNAEIYFAGDGGIGIGTTSGGRDSDIGIYVGYSRDGVGGFSRGEALFEGGVGIGTRVGLNDGNQFEVYKETVFFSNASGIGGTDNGGIRIGIDTASPATTFDMSNVKDGFLALPNYTDATLPVGGESITGSIYHNVTENRLETIDNNTNTVGIQTVLNETHDPSAYVSELGFLGGIVDDDADRATRISNNVDNVIQPGAEFGVTPVGFGTAHMTYNKAYNKHQYATNQGSSATDASIFRSYVSSATSALNIELDSTGTKVFITVAGVGSATLSLV